MDAALKHKIEEIANKVFSLEQAYEQMRSIENPSVEDKKEMARIRSKIIYYSKRAKTLKERGTLDNPKKIPPHSRSDEVRRLLE